MQEGTHTNQQSAPVELALPPPHSLALLLGVVGALIGACGLVSWLFEASPWLLVLPGLLAAASLVLGGLGLVFLSGRRAGWGRRCLGRGAAAMVVLTGIAIGGDEGMGRISSLAGYSHSFLGIGLLLLSWRRAHSAIQLIAGLVACAAVVIIGGYLFGAFSFPEVGALTPMGMLPALGMLPIAWGLLVETVDEGLLARMRPRLPAFGFGVAVLALVVTGVAAVHNTRRMIEASEWIERTYQVLDRLKGIAASVEEIGAANRGFVVTGREMFLEPVSSAKARLQDNLAAAHALISDVAQHRRLMQLQPLIRERLAHAAESVRLRREEGTTAAVAHVAQGQGEKLVNEIRSRIQVMSRAEEQLLTQRQAEGAARNASAFLALGFTGSVSLALLVALFGTVRRLNRRLESRVRERTAEWEQANAALRATEERVRLATEATDVGIWEWNIKTNRVHWDAQMFRIYGLTPTPDGAVHYTDWSSAVLPAELPVQEAALQETVRRAGRGVREFRIRRRNDGQVRVIRAVETVRRGADGTAEWVVGTNLDITERQQTEEAIRQLNAELDRRVQERTAQLEQSELRYRGIFALTPVSIWEEDWTEVIAGIGELRGAGITDFADYFAAHPEFVHRMLQAVKIVDVNPETLQMFEAQDKADLLKSLETVFATPDTLPGFVGELTALASGATTYRTEMALRTVRGRLLYALLTMSFPGQESRSGLVYVSVMDVTHRKEIEEQIRQLNLDLQSQTARLTQANKELEAFSYSVSHDLRAPLRAIDGFSQIVIKRSGQLDQESREHLQEVRQASQRMGHLIDDLLNLSRISRAELTLQTVDLSRLAREIVAELQRREPGRVVTVRIAESLTVAGDPSLLRVVLANLLGNAWKFTQKTAQAAIEFGQLPTGAYFVRDNGAGFDMQYVHKLFGAFQRLHDISEFEGTGIGLATVQRIMRRHGGRVWAEGAVDKGATIYFSFQEERQ